MSFILDALKKSESERQRQSGPALFEVKVAPPRGRFAIWATGLGALLAINIVVVGWMALHGSSSRSAATAAQASAPPSYAASTLGTAVRPGPVYGGTPAPAVGGRGDNRFGAQNVPPPPESAQSAQANAAGGSAGSDVPPGRQSGDVADSSSNPDDLAPAVEPKQHAPAPAAEGQITRATESGFPLYRDAAAQPGANIPDLHLDLTVFSPQPEQSFVFLNMMKLHEGESLPTGVRVEHIARDGVILSFHGTKFVLEANP